MPFLLPVALYALPLLSCAEGAGVDLGPGAASSGGADAATAEAGTNGAGNADGGDAGPGEAGQPVACKDTCTLDHATAGCVDGICELGSCHRNWGDCDGNEDNGCEQDLTDAEHCGACNLSCSLDNALETCASGACEIDTCQDGWGDCNEYAGDGCETGLETPEDCGSCGATCATQANVDTVECKSGSCVIAACSAGWMDCDGDPTNGCELDLNSESCFRQFPYQPANFDPATLDPSSAPVSTVLDCGVSTFNSTTGTFLDWCGQTEPTVVMQSQTDGSEAALLTLQDFSLAEGSTLKLEGDYPVILAVLGDATIAGTVDAAASGSAPGPGGNLSCDSAAGGDGVGDNSSGGSGGGGGGSGTSGGNGGNHGLSDRGGSAGGELGSATLTPLQGGCPGGRGGGCTGTGGAGGGAVQISAAGNLTVTGIVLANGGNGTDGCGSEGGGSGGGSGGGILLEGDVVDLTGSELQVNGGNGGRGAGGGSGGDGSTGSDSDGSDGQDESANGAGGGGGGYGRIRINSLTSCTGCP